MRNFAKPTISLRKENEVECVNARTYWSLTLHAVPDGPLFELRIKHSYPEDVFTFLSIDRAEREDITLETREEYEAHIAAFMENEPDKAPTRDTAICGLGDFGFLPAAPEELAVREYLMRTWSAFALLFEPSINL